MGENILTENSEGKHDGQIQWSGWEMSSHSEQQTILYGGLGLWEKEKHINKVIRCHYLKEKKKCSTLTSEVSLRVHKTKQNTLYCRVGGTGRKIKEKRGFLCSLNHCIQRLSVQVNQI